MQSKKLIIEALTHLEAYDEDPGIIEVVQTHISYVFLTRNFVYKVKKPVNFGFLDFSTLEKRRFYCQKGLELNRRLCGDMYIEVAPIKCSSNVIRIKGPGETVEYALKMKRMPQERILTKLLEENEVDLKLVDDIAKIIVEFHMKSETSKEISEIGSLPTVIVNWAENFEQTQSVIGRTITPNQFQIIREKVKAFLDQNIALFERRKDNGRIRDCHGDIHSGNIFVTDRVYVFDAIEFNERFRYSDVAADMAFLAMDLDFKGRKDLSDHFVKKYVAYSGDKELLELLHFYKCYRAYVRGKVAGFKLSDPDVSEEDKHQAEEEARAYFKLATSYAERL
jgi:aminoglycoside phosphotransferase family enzyme